MNRSVVNWVNMLCTHDQCISAVMKETGKAENVVSKRNDSQGN